MIHCHSWMLSNDPMDNRKIFIAIVFCLVDFICNLAVAAAGPTAVSKLSAEIVEFKLQDQSGLKLEIFQRPKKNVPVKNPVPNFPDDLVISDAIDAKKTWFPWDPRGTNNFPMADECRQESIRDRVWDNKSVSSQGLALNDWADKCSDQIARGILRRSYLPLIRFATMNYDFLENPNIHHVKATLSDGRILDGFIAMKSGNVRRPFIIAKCGMFCNAEQSVTQRAFMMNLYDESPFHVLTLANNTGSDFQINNGAMSIGGFDEGRQLYRIAQLVRSEDSPIHDQISSVHVLGASLGGAGALYSGLYSSLNDPPEQKNIQSVAAICPVVVLENSIKGLYSTKPISTFASFETLHQIRDVFSFVPVIGNYFPLNVRRMRGRQIYENLTSAIFNYYQDWTEETPWDLKPFEGVRIDTLDQFWGLNDFRAYAAQTTVPTLTISSDNDELVRTKVNARLLAASLEKAPNPNVSSVFLPLGNHCAFGLANGWANYSMILREYILSHAPEADLHWRKSLVDLQIQDLGLQGKERIVDTTWEAFANSGQMELRIRIFSPYGGLRYLTCADQNPLKARPGCYRQVRSMVPLASLPIEFYTTPPQSKYDVTSLTRFANTRWSVLDEQGELVVNSKRKPRYVRGWLWK